MRTGTIEVEVTFKGTFDLGEYDESWTDEEISFNIYEELFDDGLSVWETPFTDPDVKINVIESNRT